LSSAATPPKRTVTSARVRRLVMCCWFAPLIPHRPREGWRTPCRRRSRAP
jgi:hypothetical protein